MQALQQQAAEHFHDGGGIECWEGQELPLRRERALGNQGMSVRIEVCPIGAVCFHPAAPPSDAEVTRVTARIARRIEALLERRGLGAQADPEETDTLLRSQPLLAELYAASVSGRIATGPRAGRCMTKVRDGIDLEDLAVPTSPRCASIPGISVHTNVCIPAHDRMRLERLCRYAGRPPVATERLSLLPDGRLLYRPKRRWRDGTSHIILEPLELIERLAALVPPPRFNLVRYHGVLAPSAAWRSLVIPSELETADPLLHPNCPARNQPDNGNSQSKRGCRPRNYSWAQLMRRIFAIDVLECDRCGGHMRIIAAIHPAEAIRKILDCFGLPCRPPPIACALPARETDDMQLLELAAPTSRTGNRKCAKIPRRQHRPAVESAVVGALGRLEQSSEFT